MASAPFSTAARAQSQSPAGASTSGRGATGAGGGVGNWAGADMGGGASSRFGRGANSGCRGGDLHRRGGGARDRADHRPGDIHKDLGAGAEMTPAMADEGDVA